MSGVDKKDMELVTRACEYLRNDDLTMFLLLLHQIKDFNTRSESGEYLLHVAWLTKQYDMFYELLERDVDPGTAMQALSNTASTDQMLWKKTVKLLLDHTKEKLKSGTLKKTTMLRHMVLANRKYDCFELLHLGADPHIDTEDIIPLHVASLYGLLDVAKILVRYGAYIDAKDNKGLSALAIAARSGRVGMVKYLLSQGADPFATDNAGESVLMLSLTGYGTECFSTLLEKYPDAASIDVDVLDKIRTMRQIRANYQEMFYVVLPKLAKHGALTRSDIPYVWKWVCRKVENMLTNKKRATA